MHGHKVPHLQLTGQIEFTQQLFFKLKHMYLHVHVHVGCNVCVCACTFLLGGT